ncbi:hypothetical protein BmR1_04g05975 [Babesia microti strain RI]|uniref:BSD domain-containing protein n=1 Tax=Babesia microti (strain RI) TaxID=1133968 RepID=A0A1N6LXL0_BABMR|nr:hypothetical protein BmR1_04g05975 [Babesia microti strain RI]SIO73607.1 hypothetical protein BmR1_04g05975 [Babesia microti strain RI]|eukprot:XP_021337691.1 hypothetical protein BmR1_04g05975 [Babesia microti strain RI]
MGIRVEVILESSKGILQLIENEKLAFTPENSDLTLLWDVINWQKFEKAKKNAKVRLTFSKRCSYFISNNGNLASELELYENLQKNVIIIDFENNRDALEQLCNELSTAAVSKLKELQEAPKIAEKTLEENLKGNLEEEPNEHLLVLSQENEIKTLYNTLVRGVNNALTADEFWRNHREAITKYKPQIIGRDNASCFMASPPSFNDSIGSSEVYYTEEMTSALLEEDETVRNIYNHVVGTRMMKKEEFWKQLFQSHYIYDLLGKKFDGNKVLYYEIQGIPINPTNDNFGDHSEVELISKLSFPDKKSDRNPFNKLYDSLSYRFGPHMKYKEPTYDSFVLRFNRHSSRLINELDKTLATQTEQDEISKERKRNLVLEALRFDDLLQESVKQVNTISKENLLEEHHIMNVKRESKPLIVSSIKPLNMDAMYSTGKRIFIVNTKSCQTDKTRLISLEYDPPTVDRVRQIQLQLIQLLQVFYKTLIHQDVERRRLLVAMRDIKLKLDQSQEKSLADYAGVSKALHAGLLDQINTAECYDVRIRNFINAKRS